MQKFSSTLFLYCLACSTIAADPTVRENYLNYHKRIIKCEEQFLFKDNLREAIRDYRSLFNDY